MLTRDLYKHFLFPEATHKTQKLFGRIGVCVIVGSALIVATTSSDALVLLGGLAVAYGFQMWPALMAVCWFPWFTRMGIVLGLIAALAWGLRRFGRVPMGGRGAVQVLGGVSLGSRERAVLLSVDGALVGGASLKTSDFSPIIAALEAAIG